MCVCVWPRKPGKPPTFAARVPFFFLNNLFVLGGFFFYFQWGSLEDSGPLSRLIPTGIFNADLKKKEENTFENMKGIQKGTVTRARLS